MCGMRLGETTHGLTRLLVFSLIVTERGETEQCIGVSRLDGQNPCIGFLCSGDVSPTFIQLRQAEIGLDVCRMSGDRTDQCLFSFSRFALQHIQAG